MICADQTTSRETRSAFGTCFVNSYGQISGTIGLQIFSTKYAPRICESFASATALVGVCALIILLTWWVTRKTEADTRQIRRLRVQAQKKNFVLDDVVDSDLR